MAWSLEAPCKPPCEFQQEESSVERGSRQCPVPAHIQKVESLYLLKVALVNEDICANDFTK